MLVLWGSNQSAGPAPVSYWITSINGNPTDPTNPYNISTKTIGVDSAGNSYSLAEYDDSSVANYLVSKYDTNGAIQWQTQITNGTTNGGGFYAGGTVDSSGNVYFPGVTNGSNGSWAAAIIKLNSSGVLQWQAALEISISPPDVNYYSEFLACAIAPSGTIYVVGDDDENDPTQTIYSGIVANYSSSGALNFKFQLFDATLNYTASATGVCVDTSGNYSVLIYGGATLGAGNTDFNIVKFNSSNIIQWQKGFYPPALIPDYVINLGKICTDSSGNIYCCGQIQDVSGSTTQSYASLFKINSSGTILWAKQLAAPLGNYLNYGNITLDSSGNVYVIGGYYDATTSTNIGVVCKYNSSGVLQWQRTLSSNTSNIAFSGIVIDSSGIMHISGSYNATNSTLTIKLPSDGSRTGTYGPYTYAASSFVDSALTLASYSTTLTTANNFLYPLAPGYSVASSTLSTTVTPV